MGVVFYSLGFGHLEFRASPTPCSLISFACRSPNDSSQAASGECAVDQPAPSLANFTVNPSTTNACTAHLPNPGCFASVHMDFRPYEPLFRHARLGGAQEIMQPAVGVAEPNFSPSPWPIRGLLCSVL